jgi:serine/threonine protein kinase
MAVLFDCPRLDCWQAFFQGTIPQEQRQFYERHLESCPDCQERLDRAEEYQDGLRHLGQQVGDPTQAPADPTLSQFVERLLEAKVPIQPPLGESADLYFLRPSECPGVLGTLGAYEVQEVIGRGGMGIVLKAFDPPLRRLVAIKVMAAAVAGSRTARLRFTREAHAAAAVCHDHVVAVHGVHEADGLPYLIMQYVPGESLQARLDRGGPLEVEEVVRIGMQTAAGLAAAHTQGLIHRDIKPANLLLEGAPGACEPPGLSRRSSPTEVRVKITDFGLARMADDIGLTRSGVVAGTPEYMAPEQARGEQVDHRADLFSLGSVLYACCTGVPPFRGESVLAILRGVNEEAPPPIHARNPEVPAWLKALVARLMAKDPDGRFHSAAEVTMLLEGYLNHLRQPKVLSAPELPPPPAARGLRLPAHGSRFGSVARRFWLLLLMLLVALDVGLLGWLGRAGFETGTRTESHQEYYQSLKGKPGDDSGLDLFGPEVDQCVLYEPAGLRITLPAGCPGERPSTGVSTRFHVKGDFEITVSFEVLKEPAPAEVGKKQTRVSLEVILDSPQFGVATLSRIITGMEGKTLFQAWQSVWNGVGGKKRERVDPFPTTAKSGRFRLARTGAVLSYYVAENDAGDFTLLCQYPFSEEDLKAVNLAGSTGDVTAALDVRFTDLRIRAQSLPRLPEAAPPKSGLRVWSLAALLGLLFFLVTVPLAVWFAVRRGRRAGQTAEPFPPPGSQRKLSRSSRPWPVRRASAATVARWLSCRRRRRLNQATFPRPNAARTSLGPRGGSPSPLGCAGAAGWRRWGFWRSWDWGSPCGLSVLADRIRPPGRPHRHPATWSTISGRRSRTCRDSGSSGPMRTPWRRPTPRACGLLCRPGGRTPRTSVSSYPPGCAAILPLTWGTSCLRLMIASPSRGPACNCASRSTPPPPSKQR